MEGKCIASKKESSFEILPNSDDDDALTTTLYSSTESSTFESLNSCYFLESITNEAGKKNILKTNCSKIETQNFRGNLDSMRLSKDLSMESSKNSNDTLKQTFNNEKILTLSPADDNIACNAECEIIYTIKNLGATKVEKNTSSLEITDETIRNQLNGKMENYSEMKTLNGFPFNPENYFSIAEHPTPSIEQKQCNSSNHVITLNPEDRDDQLYEIEKHGNSVLQTHADRDNYPLNCCSLVKQSLRICRSFWNNRSLQNLISGVKSSFYNLLNIFELEVNLMMGMKDPLKILIVAETSDSLAIEEAFYQSLNGQVIVSKFSGVKDFSIPILPVGYNSALLVVQRKIDNARLLHDPEKNTVIVSTTSFITEVYPQRWQLSTVLCLEDPNLVLNLHNFTSTIPVPNDYILQAQRLTPDDYPFKEMGFAVTLEQAIGCTMDTIDLEEILSGIYHLINLKSAAKILAGMYSKYVNRYV